MSTLLTDESSNDLYLNDANNLATSNNRLEEIKQLVNNKLQTFLGEIPINLDEGVDYFGVVLNKFIDISTRTNEILNNILEVPGVIGIESVGYTVSNGINQFEVTIQTDAGNFSINDIPLLV